MNLKISTSIRVLAFAAVLPLAYAETTTTEKVQNKSEGAVKDLKQGGREMKKDIRNSTGNHSTKEDIKDGGKNIKDDIEHGVKKTKRKLD